ncbi:MAG: exodeoxyribonuclease VII large subunit, partial [Sulfitobacter sp.]
PRQKLDMLGARLGPALTAGVQKRNVRLANMSGALRPGTLRRALQSEQRRFLALVGRFRPDALGLDQRRKLEAATVRFRPEVLLQDHKRKLDALTVRFRPEALVQDQMRKTQLFQVLARRLSEAGQRQTQGWRKQVAGLERLHETLSYKSTLARGYAVVRGDGDVVTTKKAAQDAASLEIEFADGRMQVGGKPTPRKASGNPPEQGTLF